MADELGAYALDPAWARRSFDRAAQSYDAAAVLHAKLREELLERLEFMAIAPPRNSAFWPSVGRAAYETES